MFNTSQYDNTSNGITINKQNVNKNTASTTNRSVAVVPKYAPMLYTLLALLCIDFLLNSFSELAKQTAITMLVLYM